MEHCIFCNIVSGALPAEKVYENERTLAFLDTNPVNPGHTLIVSKEHHPTALETPDETLLAILRAAKRIAPALAEALGAEGFTVTFNNGSAAGQVVFHTHLHVIPRKRLDGLSLWPQQPYPEGEAARVGEKIRSVL